MKTKFNKKGQTSIVPLVVGIFIVIFFVITIIILVIFLSNLDSSSEEPLGNMKLYVNALDSDTGAGIDGEYLIKTEKGDYIGQGELDSDSLVEISDVPKEKLLVYCFGDNYYSSENLIEFSLVELQNNASSFTCENKPIGQLEITHSGSLVREDNTIFLNVTSDKHFRKLSAVVLWSSGIINFDFNEDEKTCDIGFWETYSYKNDSEEIIVNLPPGHYRCENEIEICKSITENRCLLDEEIPVRYGNSVDDAIYFGRDIDQETITLRLFIKTNEIKNEDDYFEIRFYDKDLVHKGNGILAYESEYQGEDVGSEDDFTHKIFYTQ